MLLLPQIPTASLKVPRLLCTSDQLEKNSGFLLPLMFDNLKKKKHRTQEFTILTITVLIIKDKSQGQPKEEMHWTNSLGGS